MKKYKRSTKSTPKKKLYLGIVSLLRQGLRPAEICKKLKLKKQTLQYHLNKLKADKVIEKIGYAVWKVNKKEVQIIPRVGRRGYSPISYGEDSVRAHAFQIKLAIPILKNWHLRTNFLKKKNIIYSQKKGYQSLMLDGVKVWLCNKAIIYYLPKSYFADTAAQAYQHMVYDFKQLIKKTESLLNVNLKQGAGRGYKFKVSRNHYALIKNHLAQQYDREGNKLKVWDADGLWFLIDNSFNLHEAETVHSATAKPDNKKVQDFFNLLKKEDLNGWIMTVDTSLKRLMESQELTLKILEKDKNGID